MDDLKCRYRLNGPIYVFSLLFFGAPAYLYGMAAAKHKFGPFYPRRNLFFPTQIDIYIQWGICAIFSAAMIYGVHRFFSMSATSIGMVHLNNNSITIPISRRKSLSVPYRSITKLEKRKLRRVRMINIWYESGSTCVSDALLVDKDFENIWSRLASKAPKTAVVIDAI